MDEVKIRLRHEAESFNPAGPDLAEIHARTVRRAVRRRRGALAVGAFGTAATIGGLVFALALNASPSVPRVPSPPPREPSKIFFASRQPFVPQSIGNEVTVAFPDGIETVLTIPHLNTLSALTPFATLYPADGCGGSLVFGWRGVATGMVDPSTGVELTSSGTAFLFEGQGDWQPYYLGLTAEDWTVLIPCASQDRDRVQATASHLAEDLTVSVKEGLPTLSAEGFAQLGSSQDEGGAPALQLLFEPNNYLELSPQATCSNTEPTESAGITQWCLSGANLAVHARAEGNPAIVRDLVNDLMVSP